MRGDTTGFEVSRPRTLARALAELAAGERPMPLAGGTDLFVALNDGRAPAERYLDLSRLAELTGIAPLDGGLWLGASTTYTQLLRSRLVARRAPALAAMAGTVGASAIQNRGTLGGSLGNASPAADPAPVLLAFGAEIELARRDGRRVTRRRVAAADFFVAYRETAARPDELITGVLLPAEALRGWRYAYRKVGTRKAQAISKVVAAAGVRVAPRGGRVLEARIGYGSVAPTPVRARAAEAAILGRPLGPQSAAAAADALLAEDIRPIDDLRSTAEYRARVAGRLLEALLGELGGFSPRLAGG